MKKFTYSLQSRRSSTGFTLVEMLVVIAIIAILAGVLSVAAGNAINAAKRSKANATAAQIQAAILNYDTEYGTYPVVPPAAGAAVDTGFTGAVGTTDEKDLMIALCGNINAGTATATASLVPNTRQIAYLTPKRPDVDSTTGIIVNPFTPKAPYVYFAIAMDSDYSGILGDTGANTKPPDFPNLTQGSTLPGAGANLTQGVAVWACCDPAHITTPTASKSPQFWVHTY